MHAYISVQTHTKWQQRKEALETLLKLTGNPKLEPGEYGELIRMLKKVCIHTYIFVRVCVRACVFIMLTQL